MSNDKSLLTTDSYDTWPRSGLDYFLAWFFVTYVLALKLEVSSLIMSLVLCKCKIRIHSGITSLGFDKENIYTLCSCLIHHLYRTTPSLRKLVGQYISLLNDKN